MSETKEIDELTASATLVLPQVSKQSAKYLEFTMKNAVSDDSECDPDIQVCFQAQANAYKINSRSGKKQLEAIGNIVNSINDKFKGLMKVVEKYGIPLEDPDVERFVKRYRAMCSALKKYSMNLKEAKSDDNIQVAFRTINYEHDKFIADHNALKITLGDRASYEPKSYLGQFWSLIKWVWNYKYIIYISGLLLYNMNVYVFPEPITLGLNFTIRIAGAICYTFASDRVSMAKVFEVVIALFMMLGSVAAQQLPGFVGKIIGKMPKFTRKLFNIGSSVIFYLFTYFTIDWISYILKLICQGILITGSAIQGGKEMSEGIWLVFAQAADEIKGRVSSAAEFIKKAFEDAGDKITEMLTKLFVGILYEGVVNPTIKYAKALPGNIWNAIKSKLSWSSGAQDTWSTSVQEFQEPAYDKMDDLTQRVLEYMRNTDSSMADDVEIISENLGAIATMSSSQNALTVKAAEQFTTAISAETARTYQDILQTVKGTAEKVKEKIQEDFQSNFEKMGTKKLWDDLQKLEFRNSIVPYMIGVMMVLSVLSIMFGVV